MLPSVFDSHCHLHDARVSDPEGAIARARAAGVRGFLLAGVDPEGWLDEERVARGHGDVFLSLGVHPQRVAEVGAEAARAMVDALAIRLASASAPRAVAVGEIGLDAVDERKASLELQERIFRAQLAIARALDLPVALHVLRAHGRALEVLARDGVPRRGGVVHSYSGAPDLAPRYLDLGLHLSFAGGVTRASSRRARESVVRVPAERLLVETDAPDQAPAPHEGGQNEPALLPLIVGAVAALRGETAAEVACYTDANARRLFGIEETADASRATHE
jgi:TatD DNase family protein